MNIVLILICVLTALMCGLLWFFIRKIAYFEGQVKSFIVPPDEKTPSALARVTEVAGDMVARSIMAQAKTFLMGLQSGAKRAETAIQADIAEGNGANPVTGILSSFPALKRTLRRNPGLLDMAMGLLGSRIGVKAGVSPSNGEQPKFKL